MAGTDGLFLRHLLAELRHWPENFEKTLALQTRQVRRLIQHAEATVPFYRRVYQEAGFSPVHFNSLGDLRKIPLTNREQRQNSEEDDLLAVGLRKESLVRCRTSGSSGRPINIFKSKLESALYEFVHWRMYRDLSTRVRDKRASVALLRTTNRHSWYRRIGIFPMDWIDLRLPVKDILSSLREAKPDILICSSSTAAWLASEMKPIDSRAVRPRLLITWGDTITPEMRDEIGRAFQTKVVDFYGSHETRMIANQCRDTGFYHLYENMTLVEILQNGEPVQEGEEGEVVITSLWSYAMPFIRYRQGDTATMGPKRCPCGAPVRTLARIQGRLLDLIPIPGRESIHPYNLIQPVVQGIPWIKRFQFVQAAERKLRLLLVTAASPSSEELLRVLHTVQRQLGAQIDVTVELVNEIPMLPTGKFYPYLSLERQEAWRKLASSERLPTIGTEAN